MDEGNQIVSRTILEKGCPTSVLEAMSYGVPVVGYSVGGLPELVRHMQDGLLVPQGHEGSCRCNCKAVKEPELASKMASSSLARCETEFQLKTVLISIKSLHLPLRGLWSMKNIDPKTVRDFGREWSSFDQSQQSGEDKSNIFDDYFHVFHGVNCRQMRWELMLAVEVVVGLNYLP